MDELQVEPSATAKHMYEQVLASEPAAPAGGTRRPLQLGGFETNRDPLVGRDAELAQLEEEIARLLSGRGNLVVLTGDSGLGKSRLITEAAERAAKQGALTLWGAAYRSRRSQPYHLVSVLLDSFALRVPPENLQSLLGRSGHLLAELAPSLARALDLDVQGSVSVDDSSLLASAMLDFFAQLTRFAPVAVVLDNLHLADDASLQLVGDLAGLLQDMPVLLLTAYRDAEMVEGSALDRLRNKILEEETATIIELAAISVSDTEHLATRVLGGVVDAPVVETIYRLARGNLHYTREAIEALQGRKRIVQRRDTWQLKAGIAVTWGREQLRGRPESGDFQLVRLLRA
jgi:predicted ATPase